MLVRDFAEREGVTPQAVYKLLKTHAEILEGHVVKCKKGTELDPPAQAYLQARMVGNQVVNVDRAQAEKIDQLQREVRKLQDELIVKNQVLIEMQNKSLQIEEKQEEKVDLAVSKAEEALRMRMQSEFEQVKKQLEDDHQADLAEKLGELRRIRGEQNTKIDELEGEIDRRDRLIEQLQAEIETEAQKTRWQRFKDLFGGK